VLLLIGLLKLSHELTTPIHLDCFDLERHTLLDKFQVLAGIIGSSSLACLQHIPAGDHISRGEVFEVHARYEADIQCVYLHHIPGLLDTIVLGFAQGKWTLFMPFYA